jgi:hypothetical protein
MLEVLTGGPVDDLATAARIAAALHPSFEHTIPRCSAPPSRRPS